MVEFLAQHAQDREPSDVGLAMERTAIERELMLRLGTPPPSVERRACVRVPGRMPVKLHMGSSVSNATILDLGEGGMRVSATLAPPFGSLVDVEMMPAGPFDPHPPRAECMVCWLKQIENRGFDLGLRFIEDTEAHRRRMRRMVVVLLRAIPL